MDKRINRFKLCDLRFIPYLVQVIERLPPAVKEEILNDVTFQIITDEELCAECVVRYEFSDPVKTLVYLNTKILTEPDHQIIHTIASEIARYNLRKEGVAGWKSLLDNLLIEWGFAKEAEAVWYGQAISDSDGYKIGYRWAKRQNHDYLRQHFGLYFDQWNDKGLPSFPSQEIENLRHNTDAKTILENIIQTEKPDYHELKRKKIIETISTRNAMLAGILTALKEQWLKNLYCKNAIPARHSNLMPV